MSTPGYNPLTKAFDEAKTFRVAVDDLPAGESFVLDVFATPTDTLPELTKASGIFIAETGRVVEIAFTSDDTAGLALGVHYYRLVTFSGNERVSFGPLVITNVAPGGAP